ncbi:P-type DNA transfer ATPase VirB11 [Lichenicola cladoniae]|uniref:P-type DNA transfer ATPase VirB11 n=1 Tax=Lichenicola cladoniae TaxID=1484109 RepID=UPI001EF65D6D|nr:P-type DNA transfer ATPase VirB11 [Lichenicola cladoniae]
MRRGERTLRLLLAPIAADLADDAVTEVVINRPGEVGIERRGGWTWRDVPELTFDRLDGIAVLCAAMSSQDVGPDRPLCGSMLPDGQRVQICRPPAVEAGTVSLTIRRPNSFSPSLAVLESGGLFAHTMDAQRRPHPADDELCELHRARDWRRFFALAVRSRKTMLASGDTGSGKTTVAKALIQEIPDDERLVTIEDAAEFNLARRNVVPLFYSKGDQGLAKVRSEELIEAALRMRPDRVLMQELRDGAAFSFIRGVAAGHPGSITTLHAGSAAGAFDALRLMVKQHEAGRHLADPDVRAFLRQLVDVVIHCEKRRDGSRGIREVWFDPDAKLASPAPILVAAE